MVQIPFSSYQILIFLLGLLLGFILGFHTLVRRLERLCRLTFIFKPRKNYSRKFLNLIIKILNFFVKMLTKLRGDQNLGSDVKKNPREGSINIIRGGGPGV